MNDLTHLIIVVFILLIIVIEIVVHIKCIVQFIKKNFETILALLGTIFLCIGLSVMLWYPLYYKNNENNYIADSENILIIKNKQSKIEPEFRDVFNGLSIIGFGLTLFSMSGTIKYTTKENNTSHDDIEIPEQNNNILNKNSHDEIERLKQQNDALTIQLKEKTDKLHDCNAISQKNLDNILTLSNQLFILKKEKTDLYKEIESLKQQNKDLIELLKESKQTYTYKKTRKNGEYKKQLKPRSKEE